MYPCKNPRKRNKYVRISLLRFGRQNNRDYINVCLCGYNVLLHKNIATDRAMFSLGQTRFGTGRLDRFVNDLGVTLGGNGSRFPLPAGTGTFLFSVPGAGCRPNDCPLAERVPVRGAVSVSPGFMSDSSGSVSVSTDFVSDSTGFKPDSSGSVSVSADSEPDSSGSVSDSSDSLSVSEPIPDSVPWESVSAAVLRSIPNFLSASVVLSSGGFFIQDKNVPIQSINVSNIAKTRLFRFIIQIVPSHVVIFNSF